MDLLSDTLSSLRMEHTEMVHLDLGGQWVLRREPLPNQIGFCTVMRGPCWLVPAESGNPLQLETGDCVVVVNGGSAWLCNNLEAEAMPSILPVHPAHNTVVRIVTGSEIRLLGGCFLLEEDRHHLILNLLPNIVHVKGASEQAEILREALEGITSELENERMGRALMVDHLVQRALIAALRTHSAETDHPFACRLRALADQRIGLALKLMHDDVARPWTVEELAEIVGMSRSMLALQFKNLIGMAPLKYLLQWRMRLAARRIRTSHDLLATVASDMGYRSLSAFSNAFKRVYGYAPSMWRIHKLTDQSTTPAANDNRVANHIDRKHLH